MLHRNRLEVVTALGDSAVIWIDPQKVRHFAPRQTRTLVNKVSGLTGLDLPGLDRLADRLPEALFFRSFILRDRDCASVRPIARMKHVSLVQDLLDSLPDYRRSRWFQSHLDAIAQGNPTKHKEQPLATESDVCQFFETSLLPMVEGIRRHGYDSARYPVEGRCFIGPEGEIFKGLASRHRFAVALLTGVRRFPLRVSGVHEAWAKRHLGRRFDLARLRAAIATAGHDNA